MRTITCVLNDLWSGTADPLIYTVKVNTLDKAEIMSAIIAERARDLGEPANEIDIDLLFAFEGDCQTIADWRE